MLASKSLPRFEC